MSNTKSDDNKDTKFGTIGIAWAPTISTDVVKRIIDAEKFREDIKKKAKTIQSPNNDGYRKMVYEETNMGCGFIPPTEKELSCGFDDDEISYKNNNGIDR